QIKRHFPGAVGIFILPPSIEALGPRLRYRAQAAPHVIARRLLAAGGEMSHASECQYVIFKHDSIIALTQLTQIISASRLRYASQAARYSDLCSQLRISKTPA